MKRLLFIAALLLAVCSPASAQFNGCQAGFCAPKVIAAGLGLQTSVTAMWEYETTSWTDSSGNGNTLTGLNSPTTTPGVVGNAVNLVSASSQDLNITNNTGLQLGAGNFSIQVWVNTGGGACAGASPCILSKDDGGFGNREWGLGTDFISSNVFSFTLYNAGIAPQVCDTATTVDTNFHHIVVTYDGTNIRIYVDNGSPTVCAATASIATTSSIFVGKDGDSGTLFNGKVDQTPLYKGRVLTAGDVSLLYNGGNGLSWTAMH